MLQVSQALITCIRNGRHRCMKVLLRACARCSDPAISHRHVMVACVLENRLDMVATPYLSVSLSHRLPPPSAFLV